MGEVAPGVEVIQSRFWRTNTVIVDAALVVDPGVYDDEVTALVDRLGRVDAGIATHAHWDHLVWSPAWRDVPRWASAATIAAAPAALASAEPASHPDATGLQPLRHGEPLDWNGRSEIVPVVTDAHAAGHTSLHLPDRGVLLAGDLVSDVDVPFPDLENPDPFASYHAGLDRLAALRNVAVVVPGHGNPCDGRTFRLRLDADRRFLDSLDLDDPRLTDPAVRKVHEATLRWVSTRR